MIDTNIALSKEVIQSDLPFSIAYCSVIISCILGFLYGIYNWKVVMKIDTEDPHEIGSLEEETAVRDSYQIMNETSRMIQKGALTFLLSEYLYLGVFIILFSIVIIITDSFRFYTAVAFILGSITSLTAGFLGMYIATRANVRVTYTASKKFEKPMETAFVVAFRGGCVMGFFLVSLGLFVLTGIIYFYITLLNPQSTAEFTQMFEFIAGYGLGGSSVALFCRVGGGIYTKAADVGADLVGKNILGLDEDSPDNPATIADNVGDNVGDIAGMGSDLFGSFAESTSAALVVSGTSIELIQEANFFFPLLISAFGIIISIITSFFATNVMKVDRKERIESTLKWQLLISTILLIPTIIAIGVLTLPKEFTFVTGYGHAKASISTTSWKVVICALFGLISGLIIGYVTDYFTSHAHQPTRSLSQACVSGAAINIIQGLALGYLSTIIPIICISVTIFASFKLSGMYGIAIAALGMLSNLAISLAIDGYGPISDNAGGIAEMSELGEETREITDALDAAGNTTAAIGKGFAIGSACLVALALFGAFVTRTGITIVNILEPIQISCLIIGAMIPYAFSALTMKSVGTAAEKMCEEILIQVRNDRKDYNACIKISTEASLSEMILPGIIVSLAYLGYIHSAGSRWAFGPEGCFWISCWGDCLWGSNGDFSG